MAQRKPRRTIGLILSNVTNDFSGYLIEQMEELFTANGYKLIITTTNHSIDSEREMLQMFGKTTDGILIISDAVSYSELADAIPRRIPVIFLNRKPAGCPHTCIIENNYSAIYQAVLSNSANGNDKIALVCSNREFSTTQEIVSAYRDAMNSTPIGFHEDWIYYTDTHMKGNPETLLADMIKRGCNTVLAGTQTLTRKFWDHMLIYNHDAREPVVLIGFANKDSHKQTILSFDTIAQPLQELIELSVQQMLYLINTPDKPAHEYLLKGSFRTHSINILYLDNK
ncbi:MAG: substrate-binding domain-containing protein [Clostridiales bacterium]|nr:substrate-binding domain-containing protein [Roseburia sp.]MDD7637046.1 substrate-binding domain-containing protein [Clostridiales bacterium]MDY4111210.1 substrate-binding domain-containing protein [Roseburia sp.]